MSDIVLIPTHERPEFLWITLEAIAAASHLDGKEFWIMEDSHIDQPKPQQLVDEIATTVEHAKNMLPDVQHFVTTPHSHVGSSFNVLQAFKMACHSLPDTPDLIYFIEDDVIVTPDFFRFCEAAQDLWDPFATGPNCSPVSKTQEDPSLCEISSTWMQTFAMSFQRERLQDLLLPEYEDYKIMANAGWYEWDEWMCKAMFREKQYIVNPVASRGFHFGVYSYHTGKPLEGSLAERIAQTRAIVANPSAAGVNASRDIKERIPTSPYAWSKLRKHGWRSVFPNRGPRKSQVESNQ